jgi:hypothetical protein
MNERYQRLASAGESAVIKYKGQEVDPRKLRRQAKLETRRSLMGAQAKDTTMADNIFPQSPLVSPAANLYVSSWSISMVHVCGFVDCKQFYDLEHGLYAIQDIYTPKSWTQLPS